MSRDLISRKEAIDALHGSIFCADAIPIIEDLPTAYSVEAVVRELEEKIEHHWEHANYCHDNELYIAESEHIGKCEAFREAIAIVKRGGRNE